MALGQRILLVEDDADLAEVLALVLDAVGYATEVASTAAMAYQCLNGTTYSLVIADVRLPDGDGAQVADEAAERGFKTAILSGYVHQLTPAAKVRHEVMAKPMRPAELIATVRRLIG
jgi:two-component system OmpR family response regulator